MPKLTPFTDYSTQVGIRLPKWLRDRLEELSAEEGISLSEYARAKLIGAIRRDNGRHDRCPYCESIIKDSE